MMYVVIRTIHALLLVGTYEWYEWIVVGNVYIYIYIGEVCLHVMIPKQEEEENVPDVSR